MTITEAPPVRDFVPVKIRRAEQSSHSEKMNPAEDPARLINRFGLLQKELLRSHPGAEETTETLQDDHGNEYGTKTGVRTTINRSPVEIIIAQNNDGFEPFRNTSVTLGTPERFNANWIMAAEGTNPTVQAPSVENGDKIPPNSKEAVAAGDKIADTIAELIL